MNVCELITSVDLVGVVVIIEYKHLCQHYVRMFMYVHVVLP
jgi:hypothetical protein